MPCAGMVGALCNNAIGVCGVNQRVKVMGCKFLDGSGNGCAPLVSQKLCPNGKLARVHPLHDGAHWHKRCARARTPC